MSIANPNRDYLSSYGRNRGRMLRALPQGLVDNLLPKLTVDLNDPLQSARPSSSSPRGRRLGGGGLTDSTPTLPPPHPNPLPQGEREYNSIAIEIGFGSGEHLLMQAAHRPDTLFIGCEPYINGVAKCLAGIDAKQLTNIRLFTQDARELLKALPDASIDTFFILFPDPWPKERHKKRRLVNTETLNMLARVQKPGGRLLIATDHVDYSVWILELLLTHPDYRWTAEGQADWETLPAEWTETKYQRKTSAQGRKPLFFECVRK